MRKILRSVICLALAAMLVSMVPLSACASSTVVKILNVTEDRARLRDENREVITSLSEGTKVLYMDTKVGSTSLVTASNGTKGYVYDEFLEYYGAIKLDNLYYCGVTSKPIYRTASTDAQTRGYMHENQYVVVLRTRGEWAYVKNLSGKGGFCTIDGLVKVG